MAKAGRVQHWKHGWIPITPEAKAFVAGTGPRPSSTGGRFDGDPTKQFGGDRKWRVGSAYDIAPFDDLVERERKKDRWGHDPRKRIELEPDAELVSTQDFVYPETLEKYAAPRRREAYTSMLPQVYETPEGTRYVIDGHHRLLADRKAGRKTTVALVKGT